MKTKVTLILLLLLLSLTGGAAFAQVQINTPTSYQPVNLNQGGAPGAYTVDIVNNNPAALSGATFSLALPAGMEYVANSIAGGATQLSIANLQNPTFTLNSIPVGNTLQITFNARINCGFSTPTINYSVISSGSTTLATGSSAVAGNTPVPAYALTTVPQPQSPLVALKTNLLRTIKFKNSGNIAATSVYIESAVVTPAHYASYKVMSADNGTVSAVTNGYRVTLTGAALQNAITTAVGAANTSFDPGEEITVVLTEQMLSCAATSSIALNMKAGSGDTKGSLCFFDGSSASISTPVGNPAISITRLAGTTYPDFCNSGKVSYTIANTGTGSAESSLHNVKFPWSMNYANSGLAPTVEPYAINIKKVLLNGNDVTSLVLTRNGTGGTALIPVSGIGNCVVINLAGLTSAYGTSLQSLDGDGKFDDLLAGQSFQLDFEYGFDISSYKTCSLNSQTLPSTTENYFSIGTSFMDQCGTRTNRINYLAGPISDYAKSTFQIGSQQYNSFSASLSTAALYPGDKIKLTTNFGGSLGSGFGQPGKILKTFTFILPDGLEFDAAGITKWLYGSTGYTIPVSAINYNAATKTLVITPASSFQNIYASNDLFEIPLVVSSTGTVTNKTLEYSATFGFVGCGITLPYGCSSQALNYSVISGSCATVGTTSFDMTRATFGYAPAPSGSNVFYMPTAYVNENTPGINLHGAVSKDKVKTTFKGVVNSTNFTELWARVRYTSNAATLDLSNFDPLSANGTDVAGAITITKASDGSTVTGNIVVGDIVFSYDSAASLQVQQVNLGAKIGAGKDINYILQVRDQIAVNWLTKVSKDKLSYIYSPLANLEGDLYTKDAGGIVSDCQHIPVGFSIQGLYMVPNNTAGVQAVVGTNSMRVQASIINGNHPTDVVGDHFPKETRNYAVFRSVKATIPGTWILDNAAGKEPYYNTTNLAANGQYIIDRSLLSVTYSGGNTIVTFDNAALGSDGMPLATANLPVVADWTGVNGNTSLFFYMLPVCAAPGNVTVTVVHYYDKYTTEADNSNIENISSTGTQGGSSTTIFNYTASAVPTLQNVDGIGSTVTWQLKVTNTSDTAAIAAAGGNANLPNNWISFTAPNNNITVTEVKDISTGTTYPVSSYGAGKYWVKLGDIATNATYDVKATYNACSDDKLQTTYSFGATGYPVDPDEALGATASVCTASQTKFNLNLAPKDIALSMTVTSPLNPVQFCTNTTAGEHLIDYTATVANTAVGNAEGLIFEAVFPAGYSARAGTSKFTYNGSTKTLSNPVYNSTRGTWEWNISTDLNGTPFLPGAASGTNSFAFEYQGETSCGFVSGTAVSYNMRSTSGCGKIIEYKAAGAAMELGMKPSSLNTYYLAPGVVTLKNDGSGSAYQIEVTNQGTQDLSAGEAIFVTVPKSIDYVAGSITRVTGATNVGEPLSNTVLGNNRILKFPLPTGVIDPATLKQNETAKFSIGLKIVDAQPLSCGVTADAITLEAIYSVVGVTCGASPCDVSVITGNVKSNINVIKTAFTINPVSAVAKYVSSTNNTVTVKYKVTNSGTIANSTPIVVDFFNDINGDGIYTTNESILYTQTINGAAANLATGASTAEQTTAAFTAPESGFCTIAAAIRVVDNVQECSDAVVKIPLVSEAVVTAFNVCKASDITIGTPASTGATVSWSPATYLSAANISNPVFNYTGPVLTASTIFVYTGTITHPGGCTSTITNNVTVNPDPGLIITNPAPVCAGTTVNLGLAAVTAGSDASLTLTYFADMAASISLTNYTAVTTSGTYYIKGTNANGCFTVKPVVVTINPLPTASVGATGPVCQNGTAPVVTFTGAGGTAPYTFTYKINSGSNLTVTTVSGNSVNVPAPTTTAGSFVYTLVSVKDASTTACTQAQNGFTTVTINPLPTAAISGTTAVCYNGTEPLVTFTGSNGTAPYTFTYKINGGANNTVTTTSGNSVTVEAPTDATGTFAYTLVSVKDASSTACEQTQTGTATITVKALPTATISGTTAVCQNAATPNITFTGANGTAPYTFTYKVNGGADQTVTTTVGNSVTVAQPTGTTGSFVYTLVSVKEGSTGCEELQTGSATITINELPTAVISGTDNVCQNEASPNITFTGSGGTSPYTFTYKLNGGADQTVSTAGGSVVLLPVSTTAAGTFTYTLVSVKDASLTTCIQAQTGTATVIVNSNATIALTSAVATASQSL
ncbi:hypothetical protein B0A75_09710, partial [Flavobacterium oncorhynchi]